MHNRELHEWILNTTEEDSDEQPTMDTLVISKHLARKDIIDKVHKKLQDYKTAEIDTVISLLECIHARIVKTIAFSSACFLFSFSISLINEIFKKNNDTCQPPNDALGIMTELPFNVGLLSLAFIVLFFIQNIITSHQIDSTNQLSLLNNQLNELLMENQNTLIQLFADFDRTPDIKVTQAIDSLSRIKKQIEHEEEYLKKVGSTFLFFRQCPDSTIPANMPTEVVQQIFRFAGLLKT